MKHIINGVSSVENIESKPTKNILCKKVRSKMKKKLELILKKEIWHDLLVLLPSNVFGRCYVAVRDHIEL